MICYQGCERSISAGRGRAEITVTYDGARSTMIPGSMSHVSEGPCDNKHNPNTDLCLKLHLTLSIITIHSYRLSSSGHHLFSLCEPEQLKSAEISTTLQMKVVKILTPQGFKSSEFYTDIQL